MRIDDTTAYEPDGLVYCGPKLPPASLLVSNPMIVFEILPPSTGHRDVGAKLEGYFRVPSVQHFLIVDPDQPIVIHHARQGDGAILTRIVREGAIALEPPGLELPLADMYAAPQSP